MITTTPTTWQTPEMIPVIHEMLTGMLNAAHEQHNQLTQPPVPLVTLKRVIQAYTQQQRTLPLYKAQCQRWHQHNLTPRQQKWVQDIESHLHALIPLNARVLNIAETLKAHSLHHLLAKNKAALSLNYILG